MPGIIPTAPKLRPLPGAGGGGIAGKLHLPGVKAALLNVLTLGAYQHPTSTANYWKGVLDSFDPRTREGLVNLGAAVFGPRGEFQLPETETYYTSPNMGRLEERAYVDKVLTPHRNTDGTATRKTISGYPTNDPPSFRRINAESIVRGALNPGVMNRNAPHLLAQMLANRLRAGRN